MVYFEFQRRTEGSGGVPVGASRSPGGTGLSISMWLLFIYRRSQGSVTCSSPPSVFREEDGRRRGAAPSGWSHQTHCGANTVPGACAQMVPGSVFSAFLVVYEE